MSLVVGNGLTHWFGRELALEGVDLVIDTGEHMAVLGDNGAGKTTLLRILATMLKPTSGQLQVAGLDAFKARVEESLDVVGLASVARRRAGELSRGMLQRLALARAILHEPRLLILDEPDASLGDDAADLLTRLMRDRTVVMATHDHALASRLCPRTLALRHGRSHGTASRLRVVK